MKLKVITPERIVFEADDVDAVYAKTTDGEIGILPGHIPLVTPLDIGILRYSHQGEKKPIAIMGGVLRTSGKEVSILSDAAELISDIDVSRARKAKDTAEASLQQASSSTEKDAAKHALSRALTRLKATEYTTTASKKH